MISNWTTMAGLEMGQGKPQKLRRTFVNEARKRLLDGVGKNTCYLGRPGRWGRGGEYNTTWQVVHDVPRRELLGDIEVR